MQITPVGAAGGEVTGSAYYVQTAQASVLVDCGLFQGGRKAESLNRPPVRPKQKLDAVLITHGHLDHTGRLPLLTKRGYHVPIYATPATIEMTALILRDAARIQAGDAERQNRKRQRAGQQPVEPLYSQEDAEEAIRCLQPVPYQQPVAVAPGVQAVWAECGHMLGSASIQLIVEEQGRQKRVVFSGDLGPIGAPILRDFEPFREADLVFLESTYGDRDHRPFPETVEEFVAIVKDAVESGGKLLVPTFAVGRAQLITGLLGWMFRNKKVRPFPIFLDSPMAIQATQIYMRHPELFDDAMREFIREKPLRQDLQTMTHVRHGRRVEGDQRPGRPVPDHGRRRHVHRRTDPASSEGESVEAGNARADRRLPERRLARPAPGQPREVRQHPWREDRGPGQGPHPGRLQRPRRPDRSVDVVQRPGALQAPRGDHPRRRRPPQRAGETDSKAVPPRLAAAQHG